MYFNFVFNTFYDILPVLQRTAGSEVLDQRNPLEGVETMSHEILFRNHQSHKAIRKALWIVALLMTLVVISGCAGIKPYKPRDNREEGPKDGLFSGSKGEFIIYEKMEKPKKRSEDGTKSPAPPEADSDKRGNGVNPSDDKD